MRMQVILDSYFRPPGFSLYGAGRKESPGTWHQIGDIYARTIAEQTK